MLRPVGLEPLAQPMHEVADGVGRVAARLTPGGRGAHFGGHAPLPLRHEEAKQLAGPLPEPAAAEGAVAGFDTHRAEGEDPEGWPVEPLWAGPRAPVVGAAGPHLE